MMNFKELTTQLLDWYDRNRRELPWRTETDPYRIWVSEVMLQQTRVEAVIPYYRRFLQRFPDMRALAAAEPEELLSVWQGLGYYSRARHLQQGVQEVQARYGGRMPDSREEISGLPGIGPYTAGAILSIAHNKPEPAVDGNVLRVFSRLLVIREPIDRLPVKRRIETTVREMMAGISRCGDVTQALMELGALVCVPRNPRCDSCPWQGHCAARLENAQDALPIRKAPALPRIVHVVTGLLLRDGQVLTVQRPPRGLLAGMWEFPSVESSDSPGTMADAERLLQERFRELGREITVLSAGQSLTHIFSHRQWQLRTFFCRDRAAKIPGSVDAGRWLPLGRIESLNWAGPHRKIAAGLVSEMGKQIHEKGM